MIQLSEHFSLEDFGQNIPAVAVPSFSQLSNLILEPVYEEFGTKLWITSGFRSPELNTIDHGQPNSEHIATADYCAVDFFTVSVQKVFDWMRTSPTLPYHQLILEKGKLSYVIHVSWNRTKTGIRSVLTGSTHNDSKYLAVAHVPFNPETEINA